MDIVTISEAAQGFLVDLLAKKEGVNDIKLEVARPGTGQAETMLSFLPKDEEFKTDLIQNFNKFNLYVGEGSGKWLEETKIDYDVDKFGGSLTIRSPKSKTPQFNDDSTLEEKINYTIETQVNPLLASHGGHCSLVEVDANKRVVVQFGGGCQGCSGIDMTVMSIVDNNLKEAFPEITSVIDVTDHSYTDNAYM